MNMQEIVNCTVQAYKGNFYYIKLTKNEKCDGCKACAFGKKNHLILPALSEIACDIGDYVEVAMPQSHVKGSYLYLYLLPLLTLFAGLMIPYGCGEWWMLLGAGVGLAVGFAAAYAIERLFRRRKKYLPVIVKKISEKEITNDRS